MLMEVPHDEITAPLCIVSRCEVWTQPIFSHRSCITGKDCPEADESLEQSSRCDDKDPVLVVKILVIFKDFLKRILEILGL